jgi:hypothetical protein
MTIHDGITGTAVDSEYQERALDRAINGLRADDPLRSAAIPVRGWQRAALWVLLAVVVVHAIAEDGTICSTAMARRDRQAR